MIDFIKTKRVYVIALAVLFVFVSLSETTYSLFLKTDETDNFNYNTGLLDLAFIEDEPIVLENALPVIDSDGSKNQKSYILTIKNTGTLTQLFSLKMLGNEDGIDYKYIKVKVNKQLPHSLYSTANVIASNILLYPGEETKLDIKIWLDMNTPNSELGKKFQAKIVSVGAASYKTLDNSGANHPILNGDMFPIYYDEDASSWRIADKSNTNTTNLWYDYGEARWANAVFVKDSDLYIYDVNRRHDIKTDNVDVDNGNLIIKDKYFDMQYSGYDGNLVSNIMRVKFDDVSNGNIYLMANDKFSYYYDNVSKKFVFKLGNNTVISEPYDVLKNKWYIVGYTYDGANLNFYADGSLIGTSKVSGSINSNVSFKLGTNQDLNEVSKISIGDIFLYSRILSSSEISNNYRTSISMITDGLFLGYREFTPMNLVEYYLSKNSGTVIKNDDIESFYVWIPRYKYMLWNVTGKENIDSYNAKDSGIDIIYEKGNASSGVISCKLNACFSDEDGINTVSESDNGKYYTHPAFGDETGFWVSKYEVLNLNTDKLDDNHHVIKNTEWGAIAYLAHSKYGLCKGGKCKSLDSTTGNMYGVINMTDLSSEGINAFVGENENIDKRAYDLYSVGSFLLGDATFEVKSWNDNKIQDRTTGYFVRDGLYTYVLSENSSSGIATRVVIK